MRREELVLYREKEKSILSDMEYVMENYKNGNVAKPEVETVLYDVMHELLSLASLNGFYGNLWHCYLANFLVNNENAYSRACEIRGAIEGSVNDIALHDISIIREFFGFDFSGIENAFPNSGLKTLFNYEDTNLESTIYNSRIRNTICQLAKKLAVVKSDVEMKDVLTDFYKQYGVGKFGLHKAFRVNHVNDKVVIEPIRKIEHVYLDDLVGYEIPKQKLIENTEAFVEEKPANNCLLFGDAGTGKSSSVKGILNEYYDRGLRIIEVYKHQFQDLNEVISQIRNRNYRFIIYMDDLSFEEFEIEYKYLKAVIEGGLETKPQNVLIYATSNRRHLIRESFSDKDEVDGDIHRNDTVQEKLSLVARFGVSIFFCAPNKKEFEKIVSELAKRHDIQIPETELLFEANKWELSHGGLSGRTAQQFIDYLRGKRELI